MRYVVRRISLVTGQERWDEVEGLAGISAALSAPLAPPAPPEPDREPPKVPIWQTRGGSDEDAARLLDELARRGLGCRFAWASGRVCGRPYQRAYLPDRGATGLTCAGGHFAPLDGLKEEGELADAVMGGQRPAQPVYGPAIEL